MTSGLETRIMAVLLAETDFLIWWGRIWGMYWEEILTISSKTFHRKLDIDYTLVERIELVIHMWNHEDFMLIDKPKP